MIPEATLNKLPFLTAKARLKSRYMVDMTHDDFVERAYYVWRSIGNIATLTKSYETTIPSDLTITLPTDFEALDSVEAMSSVVVQGKFNSQGATAVSKPLPISYQLLDKSIKIRESAFIGEPVMINYSAISVDPDGLPMLNDPEVEAIAAMIALQSAEIKLFQMVAGADRVVNYMRPIAEKLMLAAKIAESISDDGIDQMLDIQSSWGRHSFGDKLRYK